MKTITGIDGKPLTKDNLPPPSTTRWIIRRKAELVAAVQGGLLTLEDIEKVYGIPLEEFRSWQERLERYGINGIRTTRLCHYREKERNDDKNKTS